MQPTAEIYVVSIGAFSGRGFSELVLELFRQYGVVLLGISEDYRVVLHPGEGYIITKVRRACREGLRSHRKYGRCTLARCLGVGFFRTVSLCESREIPHPG